MEKMHVEIGVSRILIDTKRDRAKCYYRGQKRNGLKFRISGM